MLSKNISNDILKYLSYFPLSEWTVKVTLLSEDRQADLDFQYSHTCMMSVSHVMTKSFWSIIAPDKKVHPHSFQISP